MSHIYICDYHKNVIQSVRSKRKRKDSEDENGSVDGSEDLPEVCFVYNVLSNQQNRSSNTQTVSVYLHSGFCVELVSKCCLGKSMITSFLIYPILHLPILIYPMDIFLVYLELLLHSFEIHDFYPKMPKLKQAVKIRLITVVR